LAFQDLFWKGLVAEKPVLPQRFLAPPRQEHGADRINRFDVEKLAHSQVEANKDAAVVRRVREGALVVAESHLVALHDPAPDYGVRGRGEDRPRAVVKVSRRRRRDAREQAGREEESDETLQAASMVHGVVRSRGGGEAPARLLKHSSDLPGRPGQTGGTLT